jgi:hypothetical protein
VTVCRPGGGPGVLVPHALRRRGLVRESAVSQGQAAGDDVVWHLPTAELPERPEPGYRIIDAGGERFTVLQVRDHSLPGRWRCVTRNLTVAHGLDQYIDIEKAVYAKGEGGAETPAWHPWKTGVAARIQPLDAAVSAQQDRQVTALRVTILVTEDLTLDHNHRIRAADGAIYTVTGYRKSERIDVPTEIQALRVG